MGPKKQLKRLILCLKIFFGKTQDPKPYIFMRLRCGRLDNEIRLLWHKLFMIQQGMAFNGKRTKTTSSQGKKLQVSAEQEATWLMVRTNNNHGGFCNGYGILILKFVLTYIFF
ncbi:hypothetical protein Hanom_Chr07g00621351 [Helianthus anomalus]